MSITPIWPFSPQTDKFGYQNNPRWVSYKTLTHFPCGHWHKGPGNPVVPFTPVSDAPRAFYFVSESCYVMRFEPETGVTDYTYLVEGDTFAVGGYTYHAFGTDSNGDFKIVSTAGKLHTGLANPDSIAENFMVFDENFQQTLKQDYDWMEGDSTKDFGTGIQTYRLDNSDEAILVGRYGGTSGDTKIYGLNVNTGAVTLKQTIVYSATLGYWIDTAYDGDYCYILYQKGCIKYTISTDTYVTLFTYTLPDPYGGLAKIHPFSGGKLLVWYHYSNNDKYLIYDNAGNFLHELTNLGTLGSYRPHYFFQFPSDATKAMYVSSDLHYNLYDLVSEEIIVSIPNPSDLSSYDFAFYDDVTEKIFIQVRQTVTENLGYSQILALIYCYDLSGNLIYVTEPVWPEQDYIVDWFAHTPTAPRTEPKYTNQLTENPGVPPYLDDGWALFTDGTSMYSTYVLMHDGYFSAPQAGLWVYNASTGETILSKYVTVTATDDTDMSIETCAAAAGPYIVVLGWSTDTDFVVTLKNGVVTGDTYLNSYVDSVGIDISTANAIKLYHNSSEGKLWLLVNGWGSGYTGYFKLYESTDDGATWTLLEDFLCDQTWQQSPSCYFFDVSGTLHIGLGGNPKLYVYAYNVVTGHFDLVRDFTVPINPNYNYFFCNDSAVYYSTINTSGTYQIRFYKSVDLMQNWTQVGYFTLPTSPANYTWDSYVFFVSGNNIVSGMRRGASYYPEPWNFVIVSHDEGATWAEVGPKGQDYTENFIFCNGVLHQYGSLYTAQVCWNRGPIYKSSDYGDTWVECMDDFVAKLAYPHYEILPKPSSGPGSEGGGTYDGVGSIPIDITLTQCVSPIWPFTKQPDVGGYVNNPDFVDDDDGSVIHTPCGYWNVDD